MMMIGISEHGAEKCNRWLKRVAVAVKLVPSAPPVIPSLLFSLGSYSSNCTLSGIYLITSSLLVSAFHLLGPKRVSCIFSSLSTYYNVASAHAVLSLKPPL